MIHTHTTHCHVESFCPWVVAAWYHATPGGYVVADSPILKPFGADEPEVDPNSLPGTSCPFKTGFVPIPTQDALGRMGVRIISMSGTCVRNCMLFDVPTQGCSLLKLVKAS